MILYFNMICNSKQYVQFLHILPLSPLIDAMLKNFYKTINSQSLTTILVFEVNTKEQLFKKATYANLYN